MVILLEMIEDFHEELNILFVDVRLKTPGFIVVLCFVVLG